MGQDSKLGKRLLHGVALASTGWLLLATSAEPRPNRDCFEDLGDEVTLRVTLGMRHEPGNFGGAGGTTSTFGSTAAGSANLEVGVAGTAGAATSTASSFGAAAAATGTAGSFGAAAAATGTAGSFGALAAATGTAAAATSTAGSFGTAGALGSAGAASSSGGTSQVGFGSCNAVDTLGPGKSLDFELESGWGARERSDRCIGYWTNAVNDIPGLKLDERLETALDISTAFTARSGYFTLPGDTACRGRWSMVLRPYALRDGGRNTPLEAGGDGDWLLERRIDIEQAQFCGVFANSRGRLVCEDTYLLERVEDLTP